MKEIWNVSPGLLILPNGMEIAPGSSIELPKQYADNEGVASWVADGLASENPPPAAMLDELTATTIERDTLAIENADLLAKIAAMQADLDAATTPKDAPKK